MPRKITSIRLKNCRNCKRDLPINSFTSTQARYCIPCKRIVALQKDNDRKMKRLERLKSRVKKVTKKKTQRTLPQDKKFTQKIVNRYIRWRDEYSPCISDKGKTEDAGHFIAQGSSGFLRYHPDNIHGQCRSCNQYKHGNLINYRIGLVERVGEERVKWLEANREKLHKYTREQLEAIRTACKEGTYTHEIWLYIMENK